MGRKSKRQKTTKNPQVNHPPPAPPQQPPLDRLSDLPDAIVVDILSLLPTITAVTTSVLSQRWRHIWTQITALHLNYNRFPLRSSDFYPIVDRIVSRNISPVISTFYLRAPYSRPQYFEPWLRDICARQIRKIDITIEGEDDDGDGNSDSPFTLPNCIFQTQTLACLHLPAYRLRYELPRDDVVIQLPNLIKLALSFSASQCGFIAKLVRSCPLLEDLSLTAAKGYNNNVDDNHSVLIEISSENLKFLHLNLIGAIENEQVVIDAPKLDSFGLYANGLASCSFVKKLIGLRAANVITISQELVSSLFPVICNVRTLNILAPTIGLFEGNCSKFPNLMELKLLLRPENSLDSFPFELASPTMLVGVKTIEIVSYNVNNGRSLKKLAEYLLSNSPALNNLAFIVLEHPSQCVNKDRCKLDEMLFCIDLYSCSLNAPQCVIEFWGQCAKLPTNNAELQAMRYNAQIMGAVV